jgi:hypothetical protein
MQSLKVAVSLDAATVDNLHGRYVTTYAACESKADSWHLQDPAWYRYRKMKNIDFAP